MSIKNHHRVGRHVEKIKQDDEGNPTFKAFVFIAKHKGNLSANWLDYFSKFDEDGKLREVVKDLQTVRTVIEGDKLALFVHKDLKRVGEKFHPSCKLAARHQSAKGNPNRSHSLIYTDEKYLKTSNQRYKMAVLLSETYSDLKEIP